MFNPHTWLFILLGIVAVVVLVAVYTSSKSSAQSKPTSTPDVGGSDAKNSTDPNPTNKA